MRKSCAVASRTVMWGLLVSVIIVLLLPLVFTLLYLFRLLSDLMVGLIGHI